jgi:beta-glucosidase
MPWVNDVAAVLQAWYPGQECGNAITDVLFGDAEPGGRLPQTFPAKWSDNPAHSADPEIYPGKNGNVRYAEGIFIGYRHYDAKGLNPLFPFGHGLSYTRFEITDFQLSGNGAIAAATVRNTGDRAGSTVVQVYVGAENSLVDRPVRELKGFAKVDLAAGAEKTLTIPLPSRAYAYFDTDAQVWRTEEGQYTVSAGFSATDLRASITVCKTAEVILK